MAKMFYTAEEAAQRLGVGQDGLKKFVTDNKLREFRDGARVMYKVDQVDKLVASTKAGSAAGGTAAGTTGMSDSGLPLADSSTHDVISLADSDVKPASKEDTVAVSGASATGTGIGLAGTAAGGTAAGTRAGGTTLGGTAAGGTAAGSNAGKPMFDTGEVKAADSGAQTQIQSAIDDQLSLEGVGSGSGLLDLTRESDDTSLGAELLDEIYPGGDSKAGAQAVGSSTGIFESPPHTDASGPSGLEHVAAAEDAAIGGAPVGVAEVVEAADPSAGAFGGMALAAVLVMLLVGVILGAAFSGASPSWVESLSPTGGFSSNTGIFLGILVLISILFAGVGYFIGKATTR